MSDTMPEIVQRFVELGAEHCNNVIAAYSIARASKDARELRELRSGIAHMLSYDPTGRPRTLKDLQTELHWRSDLMGAAVIVTARIVELSTPDAETAFADPEEFCTTVIAIDEEMDIEEGVNLIVPDLERTIGPWMLTVE